MTSVRDIYEYMDSFAPFKSAMDFDNCGILVGSGDSPVSRALVALDITLETAAQAESSGAQLIISHHPVIFRPLRTLSPTDPVYRLASCGIAAICAHTNLDMAPFGVNTCLAQVMGIGNLRGMDVLPETGAPQWFLGELAEELTPQQFAQLAKERLSAGCVRYTQGDRPVRKVGICSGSGGDYLEAAARAGAQAFLTGELRHHEFLSAKALGITAAEAGHFATEIVVVKRLAEKLSERFPDVVFAAAQERDPAICL